LTLFGTEISMFGLFTVLALLKIYGAGGDLVIAIHFYLPYGGAALICLHLIISQNTTLSTQKKTLRCML